MKIINFEKNKIIPLTIKEYESNLKEIVTFPKKFLNTNTLLITIIVKL